MRCEGSLTRAATVADAGSGTGLLARLLLGHGNTVLGIESNDSMRAAGEARVCAHPETRWTCRSNLVRTPRPSCASTNGCCATTASTIGTDHRHIDAAVLGTFFAPGGYRQTWLPFRLAFDLDGLRGRTMSASHMPGYGHPRFEPMIDALTAACVCHVQVGVAVFEYATRRCCGQPEHRV